MDAAEADQDVKLQKISKDLLVQFDDALATFLRKPDGQGGTIPRSRVRSRELFRLISNSLEPFQELPQLLDPHLPKWIPFLSSTYLDLLLHAQPQRPRRQTPADSSSHQQLVSTEYAICKLLYTFCKIRGEKVIVRFLNVEAKYLELLTSAIETAEDAGNETEKSAWSWEQRYIVLLWISHLLLAPFDLSTISSVEAEDMSVPSIPNLSWPEGLPGIALRVLPLGIKYLASPGRERDAAKALIVRISMRRDMQQLGLLDHLVSWALKCLQPQEKDPARTPYFYLGVLSFLAGSLRSSLDTSDMAKHLQPIFETVHTISTDEAAASKSIVSLALARKMILKVMRSVIVSLLRQPEQTDENTELTETAISYLLESVADNDTPVRLLASKSLSIITLKLDPFMATQVVEAVLESLNLNVLWSKPSPASGSKASRDLSAVNSFEWHGLMLTLSHLLYRRSPPAAQLSDIIHALLLGLSFEQRSTSGSSVGSNVRDAACFGIWAVARRYTTEELLAVSTESVFAARAHTQASSILQVLATELVTTACLDPAGNIRRGASAALQELIGRHPNTVEQGIGVVQRVDYHAVARRSRALAEVAHGAAELSSQYGEAVIDGILGWRGIGDVDEASRRDAARGYGKLVAELATGSSNPTARLTSAVQHIDERIRQLAKRQVEERHGLLLCYAAVIEHIPPFMEEGVVEEVYDEHSVSKVVRNVTEVLRTCSETTFRRPELVAEGASHLTVALVPLLQALALGDFAQEMPKLNEYLTGRHRQGYMGVVGAIDHRETKPAAITALTYVLQVAVPKWLSRSEQDTVGPASKAAVTLLIFSSPEERASILQIWTTGITTKPTSSKSAFGEGYLHALAMAQRLARAIAGSTNSNSNDIVCQAFLSRWAADENVETRVALLQSLTRSRALLDESSLFLPLLADGLNDYTTNARGDVGSHVRVQALKAIQELWSKRGHIADGDEGGPWSREALELLFGNVLRLAAEKLDRVRSEAQNALALTLRDAHRPEFQALTFSSQAYFSALLNFLKEDMLHDQVQQRLQPTPDTLAAQLLAGYVTSADTGNEDLVIASRAALCTFVASDESRQHARLISGALLHNLRTNQGNDRVIIPTLELIALLFRARLVSMGRADVDEEDKVLTALCLQTQKAGYKSGSVRKIEACVKVYGGIAAQGFEAAARESRRRLGALLYHPWPKVRSMVVDEVWGLLGEGPRDLITESKRGEALLSVDWGRANKTQIKEVVAELGLV